MNQKILLASAAAYLVAAWFSEGFFHPDEHFQILEFANWKLGGTPASSLAWEFAARIRPGLQPMLAAGVIGGLRGLGLNDPFFAAFLLRVASGLAAGWLFWRLARRFSGDFEVEGTGNWLAAAAGLLWFMPFLTVRFSSENWSSIALLAGILILGNELLPENSKLKTQNSKLVWAGVCFGLAFFFRFQIAFALAGVGAWLLWFRRLDFGQFCWLAAGGLLGLGVGTAADFWFYNEWVCTPLRYFTTNITEGKAAEFGVAPAWFYFPEFLMRAGPPISVALLIWLVLGVKRQPRHLMTWVFVPFFVAHSLVEHKEMRFLFPVGFPFLFLLASGWEGTKAWIFGKKWRRGVLWTLVVINGLLLVVASLRPAADMVPIYHFVWGEAQKRDFQLFAVCETPYQAGSLESHFYQPKNVVNWALPDLAALDTSAFFHPRPGDILLHRELNLKQPFDHFNTVRVFQSLPDFFLLNNTGNWQDRARLWSGYRLEN